MSYTVEFKITYKKVDTKDAKKAYKIAREKLRGDHTPDLFRYNVRKD